MIDSVAAHILGLPAWVALVVVFLLPALESSAFLGFVFPGEIALILGGVLASESRVSLVAVLLAGIAGAVVGDSVGYLVGRRYGRRLLEGTLGKFVNHRHFDRAEAYLAERGGKAVFFGRFTAALRVMIPGLAGMSHMPYGRFAAFNVAGGATWGAVMVVLGFVGGSSWRSVARLSSRVGLAVLALVAVILLTAWLVRRGRRNPPRWLSGLGGSRGVVAARRRFPRSTAWLSERLDPEGPRGLVLTVLVALFVASTWTFLGLTQDVVGREGLATLDPGVHAWVLTHRSGVVTAAMRVITFAGSNPVLLTVLLLTGLALRRSRGSWRSLGAIVAVYGLGLVVHAVVGLLVHRARPPAQDWLTAASGWSFPSGHTIQAATAGSLLAVLFAARRSATARVWGGALASAYAGLVAASRVYLGVHWLTDVLGSLTAAAAILCGWLITRRTLSHRLGRDEDFDAEVHDPERGAACGAARRP